MYDRIVWDFVLPHIQTYLDQVEKLCDDKYAREDSSFFQAVKDYLDYTDDRVGMTLDEKGRSIGWQ